MKKTILLTGATDGIGYATARTLASLGHTLLLHGRNASKLETVKQQLVGLSDSTRLDTYVADLSELSEVKNLASAVLEQHETLDVLINNAGVLKTSEPTTNGGLDVRFVVNAIAPYYLTKLLMPLLDRSSRVVNVSSAAQSPVVLNAVAGESRLSAMDAYSQSKLAITMWSRTMAHSCKEEGPMVVAVNPGSLLGSKMVKEGFGIAGGDVGVGADILCRAALSDEFAEASGLYFDNDSGQFASPHPDALDPRKSQEVIAAMERVLDTYDS
ncbi:MAG: SDR family NAD(P)-dependent oxidoreductase [Deltaproteobacteria bacterium]|nr:MAG: SDR family NAD(P)-dependent oxidoreductase [Deltaproteobacteria bacterium]